MAQAKEDSCPSFGKGWKEEHATCLFCKKNYLSEYEECMNKTLLLNINESKKEIKKDAEEDDTLEPCTPEDIPDDEAKEQKPEEQSAEPENIVDEPEKKQEQEVLEEADDVICKFKERSKSRIVFLSFVDKSGKYKRMELIESIAKETKQTVVTVTACIANWSSDRYKPKWMGTIVKDSKNGILSYKE